MTLQPGGRERERMVIAASEHEKMAATAILGWKRAAGKGVKRTLVTLSSAAAEAAEAFVASPPSLFDTIPMVVMRGTLGAAVDGRAAVEADVTAAEEVEAEASVSETR